MSSGTYVPVRSSAALDHAWKFVRRVLFTYLCWMTGGAAVGGIYGLAVAALRWSYTGRGEAFGLMPQPLMALGAAGGFLLATAVLALFRENGASPSGRSPAQSR